MNFFTFLTKFIAAFIIGYFILNYATAKIDLFNTPAPWALLTLLVFPFTYCAAALWKVSESDENSSLTETELRRLQPIIESKKRQLSFLIIFYLLSAFLCATGLFSLSKQPIYYRIFISACGGAMASSLYSFFFIKAIMDEIQKFKSILIHRVENKKKTKEFIDTMSKKADK